MSQKQNLDANARYGPQEIHCRPEVEVQVRKLFAESIAIGCKVVVDPSLGMDFISVTTEKQQ